jgi:hypothetical protein
MHHDSGCRVIRADVAMPPAPSLQPVIHGQARYAWRAAQAAARLKATATTAEPAA